MAAMVKSLELLGEPDLGQAGGGRAGHLQRAVFRRLSKVFAEHGPVLAEQQFGGGPVEPEHGVAQARRVGVGRAVKGNGINPTSWASKSISMKPVTSAPQRSGPLMVKLNREPWAVNFSRPCFLVRVIGTSRRPKIVFVNAAVLNPTWRPV